MTRDSDTNANTLVEFVAQALMKHRKPPIQVQTFRGEHVYCVCGFGYLTPEEGAEHIATIAVAAAAEYRRSHRPGPPRPPHVDRPHPVA